MLLQKIKDDQLIARKERNINKADALTTLYSEAANIGKNDGNRESTDAEVIAVVKKFVENVKICLNATYAGGNNSFDEVKHQILLNEAQLFSSYLPTQMTEDELRQAIENSFVERPILGEIMAYLKSNYAGSYDGKIASMIAKEYINM